MKHRTKNTLREMAKHLGLKVCFVSYFDAATHGKLLPRERRILINAHKPREEHYFTLLHEIAHYLLHFKTPQRKRHARIFDFNWKSEWVTKLCSKMRRTLRFCFNKTSGKEWEADLWAMCAFIYLANRPGCRKDLFAFLDRHPEKSGTFFVATLAVAYGDTKTRLKKIGNVLQLLFSTL